MALIMAAAILVTTSVPAFATPGALDRTFGGDGKVTTPIGTKAEGAAVAVQSDGRIVVAGDATVGGSKQFALARYESGGTLDHTFGGDGKVTTRIGTKAEGAAVASSPMVGSSLRGMRPSPVRISSRWPGTCRTGSSITPSAAMAK